MEYYYSYKYIIPYTNSDSSGNIIKCEEKESNKVQRLVYKGTDGITLLLYT